MTCRSSTCRSSTCRVPLAKVPLAKVPLAKVELSHVQLSHMQLGAEAVQGSIRPMTTGQRSGEVAQDRGRARHACKAGLDPRPPTRAARKRVCIGFREIVGPVLRKNRNEKLRLAAILARLRLIGTAAAAVGDDQLVDREALGPRDLYEHAGPIKRKRMDGLRNQEVQVIQGLCANAERRKALDPLLSERGRKELDHSLPTTLPPPPDLPVMHTGHGIEFQCLQDLARVFLDTIAEGDRQSFEACEVDISGLRKLVGTKAHSKFPLVEAEGARPDDRPAEPEDAGPGEGEEHGSGFPVGPDEALRAQHARQPRHPFPALQRVRVQIGGLRKTAAQRRGGLAEISALHFCPDPKPVVEVCSPVAMALLDAADKDGRGLFEMQPQEILKRSPERSGNVTRRPCVTSKKLCAAKIYKAYPFRSGVNYI